MTFVPPSRWRFILPLYVVGGLLLGLAQPHLRNAMVSLGKPPGTGTALDVNLFMPLLAAALAFAYPRLLTAVAGAPLATLAFHIGSRLVENPRFWQWTFMGVFGSLHPILVAACVGYAAVGLLTAALVRPWRDVGPPDTPLRCDACGYLLVNLPQPRCPECGASFDPGRIARHSRVVSYEEKSPE